MRNREGLTITHNNLFIRTIPRSQSNGVRVTCHMVSSTSARIPCRIRRGSNVHASESSRDVIIRTSRLRTQCSYMTKLIACPTLRATSSRTWSKDARSLLCSTLTISANTTMHSRTATIISTRMLIAT